MVGVDVMVADVIEFVRGEEILARDDVLALLRAAREVRVKVDGPMRIIAANLDSPGVALRVIERRQDQP